ncbi:unnamed protein product, partial [Prorocentrum cordatum]
EGTSEPLNELPGQAELFAEIDQRYAHQATSFVEYTECQRGPNRSPQRGEGLGHGGLVRLVPGGPLTARRMLGQPLASAIHSDHETNETEPRTVPGGPLSYISELQNEMSGQNEPFAEIDQRDARQATLPVEYMQRTRSEPRREANQSPQRGEGSGHGGQVRFVPGGPLTATTALGEPLAPATHTDQKTNETEQRTVPGGPPSYTSEQQNAASEQAELTAEIHQGAARHATPAWRDTRAKELAKEELAKAMSDLKAKAENDLVERPYLTMESMGMALSSFQA